MVVADGVVLASSFRGIAGIRSRLPAGVTFKKAELPAITEVLDRYRGGELTALDEVGCGAARGRIPAGRLDFHAYHRAGNS